ncbi:hypothetical protein BGX33_011132 [Mortierella sp. NVP41]|nr:hypothetical protein BGX33_011132 [Mortierella sp. NVP41]
MSASAAAAPSVAVPPSVQETSSSPPTGTQSNEIFYNLAVKQKAVYQPQFRFRRWLESEKQAVLEDQTESVSALETKLPPVRGEDASVFKYAEEIEKVEKRLLEFYNGDNHRYKKHAWDAKRAKQAEYQTIADRLLGIIGGSIGRPKQDSEPVLIGIGLGQFSTKSGLSSLHSTFLEWFIQLARSLGYLVVGLNEFYTSKKCPGCEQFVAQVTMRQFYCRHCKVYHHRDVMAAHNMYRIVHGYLVDQKRPLYLQPRLQDGTYLWATSAGVGASTNIIGTSSSTSTSASTTNSPSTRRKRAASTSTQGQGQPSTSDRPSSKRKRAASASNQAQQRRRGKAAKEE